MKIVKIQYKNHPILGDLLLDLTTSTRDRSVIVLIGENGSGKSTIISSINNFLENNQLDYIEYIEVENDSIYFKITPSTQKERDTYINAMLHYNIVDSTGKKYECITSTVNFEEGDSDEITINPLQITGLNIANGYERSDISINDNLTELEMNDFHKYAAINKKTPDTPLSWNDFMERHSSAGLFIKTFNAFFDNGLAFKGISSDDKNESTKNARIFMKNTAEFEYDRLSRGEKDIIYNSFLILKCDVDSLNYVILLDEPENNLHPRWQKKILSNLYCKISKTSQLIVATHSENVIYDAYSSNFCIVLLENKSGSITFKNLENLNTFHGLSPTYHEIMSEAFGIDSIDFHEELYGYILQAQNKTVKTLDTLFSLDSTSPRKFWIGKRLSNSGTITLDSHGDSLTLPTYIRNFLHHPELREADNLQYTNNELQQSIQYMKHYIMTNSL